MPEKSLCTRVGLCQAVAPANATKIGESPKTVTHSISPDQALQLGLRYGVKLDPTTIESASVEEPKDVPIYFKDFILKVNDKAVKLHEDRGEITSKQTEYYAIRDNKFKSSGYVENTEEKNPTLTIKETKVTQGIQILVTTAIKRTESPSPELAKTGIKVSTNLPPYEQCTTGAFGTTCHRSSKADYEKSLNELPHFDTNGKLAGFLLDDK